MASDCRFTTLACERGCRVDRCEHGTIHLTLGDVTLRLSPGALGTLATALSFAQRELALQPLVANQRPC